MQGRVTGVIGQIPNGDYIQFNVTKAVILCTGDYGNDPEMVEKYCSYATDVPQKVVWQTNTGDGHKMALWIGAAIEEAPHCTMIHFGLSFLPVPKPLGTFLCVNKFGDRFQDESLSIEYIARNVIRQPSKSLWEIFDDNFVEDKYRKQLEEGLISGRILGANTIEELASKFGANSDTLKNTVERYNKLVRSGKDIDCCKDSEWLKNTIEKTPFYACNIEPGFVSTLGGLRRNIEGQVLDANWNIIPGLYVAGNTAGGFWGDTYPIHVFEGIARSSALTFGRLAGMNAVKT
jgi:fumarate reductase flavoprotein subunit